MIPAHSRGATCTSSKPTGNGQVKSVRTRTYLALLPSTVAARKSGLITKIPHFHDDSTSNHHLPRPSTKHTGSGLQLHGRAFDHFSHVRPVPCGGTKLSAKAAARSATTSRSFYECLPFLETNPRSRLGSPCAEIAAELALNFALEAVSCENPALATRQIDRIPAPEISSSTRSSPPDSLVIAAKASRE